MPRFETALEPPWYSSGLSFLALARAAKSFISLAIMASDFISARRTTGVMSPPGIETATPISECLCLSMAPSVHVTLASGTRWSASASALMAKSLTEILYAGLPSLSFGAAALITSRAARQLANGAIEREIEMRDCKLCLDQASRNHPSHVVVRDDIVTAGLEQRTDLVVRRRLNAGGCR